ncbi:MAG TPA: lactoylglutathione lyase, partial [Firmicutes bacterium]|nr:lactoylglutathione lyase [Bacillota bacterium]HCT36417.1 lactoylglutathione lyase [Bacillota bacterium]
MTRKIKQIALVVKDVQKAMDQFVNVLGIGPWDVRHFTPAKVRDFKIDG